MLKTTQICLEDLAEAGRAFKKIVPALVRTSSDPTITTKQFNALRKVLCPKEGPPPDAPIGDWKEWAK